MQRAAAVLGRQLSPDDDTARGGDPGLPCTRLVTSARTDWLAKGRVRGECYESAAERAGPLCPAHIALPVQAHRGCLWSAIPPWPSPQNRPLHVYILLRAPVSATTDPGVTPELRRQGQLDINATALLSAPCNPNPSTLSSPGA